MKPRHRLTVSEVNDLNGFLDRKLDGVGLPSQPEVVVRLLDLCADPTSNLNDFARIIRTDHAIAGRVLRLANSAMFAQRAPVSSLERACLVLGLERIKAISLGVHLSRAASCGHASATSRQVWGRSVLRACVAAEAARLAAPALVPEAFVIGLMSDAAIPLMPRLVGPHYDALLSEASAPGKLYRQESETLEFTHVDVVCALSRRWRLPDLLAKPIAWHHTRPPDVPQNDPVGRLHRIAYVTGLLDFGDAERVTTGTPGIGSAQNVLRFSDAELRQIVTRSANEYSAAIAMFADAAAAIAEGESLLERVHAGLVAAVDHAVELDIAREGDEHPRRITIAGQTIEVARESDGVVAYLYDAAGQRLMSHRFAPGVLTSADVADALALDLTTPEERVRLDDYLRKAA